MKIIYERDPDVGDGFCAFRGKFVLESTQEEQAFVGLHFSELLRGAQELLVKKKETELVFIRSDRPELLAHRLEDDLTKLIMSNVEAAIEKMSHPDVRIVVGRPPKPPAIIRAGADTLASAFGERVLCRHRGGAIECPGCGTWVLTQTNSACCQECSMEIQLEPIDSQWVSVSVTELLASRASKFFLPREWNGYRPWVEREKLVEMLDNVRKTKDAFNDF